MVNQAHLGTIQLLFPFQIEKVSRAKKSFADAPEIGQDTIVLTVFSLRVLSVRR